MEQAFSVDFSSVRVFGGGRASAVGAIAATQGSNIHFAPGFYAPHTQLGRQLLAHELTHVVQQSRGRVTPSARRAGHDVSHNGSLEREANDMARQVGTTPRRVMPPAGDLTTKSSHYRNGIDDFRSRNSSAAIGAGQDRVLGPTPGGHSSGVLQCYGSVDYQSNGWNTATAQANVGKKTTNLAGDYGAFAVNHGLVVDPIAAAGAGAYEITIMMTPNERTKSASNIRFLQTVRRGTAPGNWATKATDQGMTPDRARRAASGGWRVDRADPTTDKTPFYGHQVTATGGLAPLGNASPGKYKGANPSMYDRPAVSDPTVLEFATDAKDDTTGTSFGSVAWGFKYNSAEKTYQEETPRMLPASTNFLLNWLSEDRRRVAGQGDAAEKWNAVYGKGGAGTSVGDASVQKVPGV